MNPKRTNRRTALKVIGAGLVGGVAATGSALANDKDPGNNEIILRHFSFNPRDATVTLDADGEATVKWVHQEKLGPGEPPHDVHLFESSDHTNRLVRSSDGDGEDLGFGDEYHVKFTKSDGDLTIEEVRDDSSSADDTASVGFDGSVTLHMHCSHHDPGMSGSLTIKE